MASSLKTAILSGGQLQNVTGEELQSRNITPVGGAIAGRSPDQVKMQGTPNQKQGALAAPQPYSQTLQREQRVAQPRTERNEAEQRVHDVRHGCGG